MAAEDPAAAPRVLYAEDNRFDADLTRAYFDANVRDLALDIVHTGEECLARLQSRRYDALLLDNLLPDMDGVDVLRHLSARRNELPVVVTTSVGDEALAVKVLQLGAHDYVPKDGDYIARLPIVLRNAIVEHDESRNPQRRILYAERHPSDVDLTVARLAEIAPHLHVEVVSSASDALGRLAEAEFDLVLTDLRLPEMNALDLLKEARARGLHVPFIVVTGGGDEAAAVAALKLGAYDYIVKRDDYVTRLPYAIDHAIVRSQLVVLNRQLQAELAERRRLQETTAEALALLDTLQKHAPIGIGFMDREGRFQRVNDELAKINGLPVAAHLGHTMEEVVPGISSRATPLFRRALAGETVLNVEIGGRTAASSDERHFLVSFYQVRGVEQKVLGIGLAMAEITQRKIADSAIREHAAALADVAKQKDEFLAMLSHELRNPLAPIRTAVDLLRRAGAEDDVSQKAKGVIDRQVSHIARLLEDLLDVARITTGRINLRIEILDMRRIVTEAIETTREMIAARRHQLTTALPSEAVLIRGDETRLVQVVVNLLSNAIKYTNEGGTIQVSVAREDGRAVLRVVDTGLGIPARLLPKIFDLFTQDDRTLDRAQGGLGLGLTIVRRITELHGGTVEASSEGSGRGSRFTVTLPLDGESLPVRTHGASRSRPISSSRCLVVEDNVDAAHMLELALTLEGFQVRLAYDGLAAVESAAAFRPDVVLLDIGLPRMNGYEAARAIRDLPGLSDVHIIAVTGYGQLADVERARAAGVDSHLVKPVELDALLQVLAAGRGDSPAADPAR